MEKIALLLLKGLLFGFCSAMLLSCDNCRDHDCKPALTIYLKVTNSAGKNLFDYPDPVLSSDSVEITAVYPGLIENVSTQSYWRDGETVISFHPNRRPKEYIVSYSSANSDTLTFTNFVFHKPECCTLVKYYDLEINHEFYCTTCTGEVISIIK